MVFPPHPEPPSVPPPPLGHSIAQARHPDRATLLKIYRVMAASRHLETRIIEMYRQNRISGGVYTAIGNEATSVGTAWPMLPHDVLVPTHRDLGSHLVRGHSYREVLLQYLKRAESMTGGKDSGLHLGREGGNIVGMISHLAHMMPVAAGVALAERQQGRNSCVLTTVGDGATSLGDFHEALNFAAVQKLPVLFVIVNNQYAYSTPITIQHAAIKLADRAVGYGMAGEQIDGTDVIVTLEAAERAYERGRRGDGPTLLESVTMRMRGHSEHDDFRYVPKPLIDAWKEWDPISRLDAYLISHAYADRAFLDGVRSEVGAEIDRALDEADAAAPPSGPEATEGVFRAWDPSWTVPDGAETLASE